MPIVCLCSDCRWHARLSDLDVKIVNRHRDADNLPPAITPQRTGWPTLAVYLAWPPALQLLEIHRHWTERGLAVALEDADVAQHHDLGYERPGHAPPLPRVVPAEVTRAVVAWRRSAAVAAAEAREDAACGHGMLARRSRTPDDSASSTASTQSTGSAAAAAAAGGEPDGDSGAFQLWPLLADRAGKDDGKCATTSIWAKARRPRRCNGGGANGT
jgi:hypothetical protein